MLEWIKKRSGGADDPSGSVASASEQIAELPADDPVGALSELRRLLESLSDPAELDEKIRSEVLALIEEAGAARVPALLRLCIDAPDQNPVKRELNLNILFDYASRAAQALCASAQSLAAKAKQDRSYRAAGAACAARALLACRTWAKICLVTYIQIPSKLWRHAYLTHSRAEVGGCATAPVHLRQNRKAATTATHELLRLLMLRVSAPEMMAPEQIEAATRLTEQMGDGFTLRDRGSTDLPFCFDPDGERPPQRATADAADRAGRRFFGP
ncbi:MAG: hypothetical protein ACREUQ_05715, partial [Burkholderiales bacterium]